MADWNSIAKWNGQEGGFAWNGAKNITYRYATDEISFQESISHKGARILVREAISLFIPQLKLRSKAYQSDVIYFEDILSKKDVQAIFKAFDSIQAEDTIDSLLVNAYVTDDINLLEEIREFASLIQDDAFTTKDDVTLKALYEYAEQFGLKELSETLNALIEIEKNIGFTEEIKQDVRIEKYDSTALRDEQNLFANYEYEETAYAVDDYKLTANYHYNDNVGFTDYKPKKAISDFFIGFTDSRIDDAVDWINPFNMIVDWGTTDIPVMPEAVMTTVELPYTDGSIMENTVYKDRMFSIVAYSVDGLTKAQKESLKARIDEILDTVKNKARKLTIQSRQLCFDVRYDGQAEIKEGASFVKATIPFHTTPYGYDLFDKELTGSGVIDNTRGDAPLGVIIKFEGMFRRPSYSINDVNVSFNMDVPTNNTLVIDNNLMTCYLIKPSGEKVNVLQYMKGDFIKVPKRSSYLFSLPSDVIGGVTVTWNVRRLW